MITNFHPKPRDLRLGLESKIILPSRSETNRAIMWKKMAYGSTP